MMHTPNQQISANTNRSVLDHAMSYRKKGMSVIPMIGKQPAVKWSEFQHRHADHSEIEKWFSSDAGEQRNVGIVTGRISSIVVVDVDEDASFWINNRPKTPMIVRSGGGGHHFYYKHPGTEIRNRTRVLLRAIDLRADGGVITSGGSIHPDTGQTYEFVTPFDDVNLEDLPVFDPDWIHSPNESPALSRVRVPKSTSKIRNVRAWIRKVEAIAGQNGHSQTFKVACKLRDSGMSAEEALVEITAWSELCAKPPWSPRELEWKIRSAYNAKQSRR